MCALEWNGSDGHNDHMKRAPLKLPPDTVGVAAAKRDLIALIDRILESGNPITIARRGKPVVRLVGIEEPHYWRWTPVAALPDDDPFWSGENLTRNWRRDPRFRGGGPRRIR